MAGVFHPDGYTLALSTEIIVGFPGETDADAGVSLAFVKRIMFTDVHVLPYSARPGTDAARALDFVLAGA